MKKMIEALAYAMLMSGERDVWHEGRVFTWDSPKDKNGSFTRTRRMLTAEDCRKAEAMIPIIEAKLRRS